MTAFMNDNAKGTALECEVTCENDEGIFLAVTFSKADATGTEVLEAIADNDSDIEEFFHLVDQAKADYKRLKTENGG